MPEPQKYDAAIVPASYPTGSRTPARHLALKAEFAPLFGSQRVDTRLTAAGTSIVRPHPFPADHDPTDFDHGAYEWTTRPDGVLLGKLKTTEAPGA